MATIKTANSIKIEVGTIYTKNGNKCAKEQLWWDLPISNEYNTQLPAFTKFYFKTSNFDKIVFKHKKGNAVATDGVNSNNNYIDENNPNVLYLDGGNRDNKQFYVYTTPSRQALFFMDKDANGQTTYEFVGIFTPTAYIGEQNLEVCTKYADNLECTF